MAAVPVGELNSDSGRIAVLNDGSGSKIIASNQCGTFPFKLMKATDPRVDIDSIADYDKNVIAYTGARNWNKFKAKKDYTNPSQLKFSNIKTAGPEYLIDMKWWLDYTVKVTFTKFPYFQKKAGNGEGAGDFSDEGFLGESNIIALRPFPLHQCTDNIHLRINNRDLISYPTQMLNQRMEYWKQDVLNESATFCPHKKPSVQTTYEYITGYNTARSPWINLGETVDGDFGNECIFGSSKFENITKVDENKKYTDLDSTVAAIATTAPGYADGQKKVPFLFVNGTWTFNMREPVLSEPLDYFSPKGLSKTMNNITNIDLEYNFNNLRNMFLFNRAVLHKNSTALLHPSEGNGVKLSKGADDWMNKLIESLLDSTMTVEIVDATLSFDVATPQIPPSMPFVTDYVEFRRYETRMGAETKVSEHMNNPEKILKIESDRYTLEYMPNSIYLWVGPNDASIYGTNYRCLYNNTYAQITGVEVDYGNLSKIGHNYTEQDLFLMALRNGLEDRTYSDWTRTTRTFHRNYANVAEKDLDKKVKREFFGVGSVLRIIPGIDLCSGGEQTLIGGMKITNETIKFYVNFRPLNMFDNITYALYVAFEYNGICTIIPNFCDLAMIHIDSYNQIANAQRAPRYRISRIYGKGAWDKIKNAAKKVNNFAKRTGIVSKVVGMVPHPAAQVAAQAARSMGYGYAGGKGCKCRKMRGGMVIPPGSFWGKY